MWLLKYFHSATLFFINVAFTCRRGAQCPRASLKYWEKTSQIKSWEIKLAEMLLETGKPKQKRGCVERRAQRDS